MIIDFHTHLFSDKIINARGDYTDDNTFRFLYSGDKAKMIDHRMMIEAMDEGGIDCAVAMGFPWAKEKYCEEQNLYFAEVKKLSKGRIIPFGSAPPASGMDIDGWVKAVKEAGLAGIGEIAFYEEGMTEKNGDYLRRILRAAGEQSLPVCLHVNEPVGHDYPGKYNADIGGLYKLLLDFPDTVIILAHWGGGIIFYELMPEINKAFTNIYYDTAASPFLYSNSIYDIAIRISGPERIVFGSDFPLISFKRYIQAINDNVPSREDREKILGKNAMKILKIKQ